MASGFADDLHQGLCDWSRARTRSEARGAGSGPRRCDISKARRAATLGPRGFLAYTSWVSERRDGCREWECCACRVAAWC